MNASPSDRCRVLLVDDRPENLVALEATLETLGHDLVRANSGEEALRKLLQSDFACILMDVRMPRLNGLETAELVRQRQRSRLTPILFLTAEPREESEVLRGYTAGAVDYLHKPFDPSVLRAKVTVFVQLYVELQAANRRARERSAAAEQAQALSERARAENGVLLLELRAAVKTREEFLRIAAHELRTPLTTVLLKLGTLERRALEPDVEQLSASEVVESVRRVLENLRRLNRMVEDLLDVSRLEHGGLAVHPETVDLAAVARDVVAAMSPEARQAHSPVELHAEGPVVGQWDTLRLTQVLAHLLSNAFKYGAGRPVSVSVSGAQGGALLSVQDQGIGIPEDALLRLFVPFERVEAGYQYGGLGLGLYLSRRIVESMGGKLEVESQQGVGSRFTVLLPLESSSQPASGADP